MKEDNNMQQNTIIFRMGEETGIVIEKTEDQFKQSLFRDQYQQAFSVVNDIIKGASSSDKEAPISNIIAFCGDRGGGKTSALMSVRNILKGGDVYNAAFSAGLFPQHPLFKDNDFKVLHLIDPAFFDEKHNLLELLIGQMYADIRKADDKMAQNADSCAFGMNEDIAKRNHLMQHFHDVRKSLSLINKPSNKSAYDNLEEIDELAAGIELREKVDDLMLCYAKYFGKKRVLICIDDLDLNVSEGYTMAEEVRKYLCSPSICLVLIAIKIEQMVEVVQSYLRSKLEKEIIPDATITDMAIRYVTKLFPAQNRVNMPQGQGIVDLPLIIEDKGKREPQFDSVKDAVVKLIYRKTRYIFVNGRNLSPIVPTNLRSVRHLIGMLWEMPDISRDEILPANIANKAQFKTYFYNTWANQLRKEDRDFIANFVTNEDLTSLNKSVIQHLNDVFVERYGKVDMNIKSFSLFASIVDNRNTIQNISVGDVMYVVRYMESIATDKQDLYLLFFVKAFYSIKMYETYDVISSADKFLFVNPESDETAKYIYKYDKQIQQMNLLQRLLNGSYFTYEQGTLLPAGRDKRKIDGNQLIKDIQSLPLDPNKCNKADIKTLRLCEFFVLTTSRPIYTDEKLEYNRKRSTRGYFEAFTIKNSEIVFDALSLFYNVVNIRNTYQRWNNICKATDFYEYAKAQPGSLLNDLLKSHEKYDDPANSTLDHQLHAFISDAIIRISDIIFSILENAESLKDTHGEGNNTRNLYHLYNDIQKIGIRLYPIRSNEKGYPLPFDFLNPITKLLSTEVSHTEFDSVFDGSKKRSKEDITKKLSFLLEKILSDVKFPSTGKTIVDHIKKNHADIYQECGGGSFWKATFNLSNDRAYEKLKDIETMWANKPAKSSTFVNACEKFYGEVKI